jgi:hypothetical protein
LLDDVEEGLDNHRIELRTRTPLDLCDGSGTFDVLALVGVALLVRARRR